MSFASTLYLCPILDLLLVDIPLEWQPEVRLGLQEALVNAAKHGNKLDPSKTIIVRFTITNKEWCWIIADRGTGFITDCDDTASTEKDFCDRLPIDEAENGRGLCILHEIFDRVHWNREGTQLTLTKTLTKSKSKQPAIY